MNNTIINDQQIRELLNPLAPANLEKSAIVQSSSSLINTILTTNTVDSYHETKLQLTTLYDNLKDVFDYAKVPYELRDRQFLNKTGFAMSPSHAMTTIKDVFRVSAFVKGIDKAIKDLQKTYPHETLHILYPACGPLAPLVVPLLAYYKANKIYNESQLKVTFIDIQEGAILSLVEILRVSALDVFVKDILLMDAVEYTTKEKIHLVVLEAMQHGFTKEGHLSISKHFADLLDKDGIFLPQEVRIDAVLAVGEEEYNTQWKDVDLVASHNMSQEIKDKRVVLGSILNVNLETLRAMQIMELNENTRLVKCSTLSIPNIEDNNDKRIMLFTTNITIYEDETINEYDSGITHPLPNLDICINFIPKNDKKETDLYVNSEDILNFYYKLVGMPGFLVTKGETT
jgi:hypothetical protein